VGKELVARAIHAQSTRADHPLVKVNCAAIPENLVESELFGHEKGSFTSATSRRIGRFELARDGTLFLDEAGELPLAIQAKMLRVLQDGEFERIGGAETIETGARIIAATNRDLREAVDRGTFRSDLYYRLNVFPIHVPPLANRREDIPLLVDSFIAQFNRRMGKRIQSIHPDSLAYLCHRDWPGNVRELRHVIERAMILSPGEELIVEPADVLSPADGSGSAAGMADPGMKGQLASLEAVERDHIEQVLRACNGVIEGGRGASLILGIKPSTLRSRMKRLGIKRK
jgi:transcriptional regulator with GAF, ATPase, and Fis domain